MNKVLIVLFCSVVLFQSFAFASCDSYYTDNNPAIDAINDQKGQDRFGGGLGLVVPIVDTKYGTPEIEGKWNVDNGETTVFAIFRTKALFGKK